MRISRTKRVLSVLLVLSMIIAGAAIMNTAKISSAEETKKMPPIEKKKLELDTEYSYKTVDVNSGCSDYLYFTADETTFYSIDVVADMTMTSFNFYTDDEYEFYKANHGVYGNQYRSSLGGDSEIEYKNGVNAGLGYIEKGTTVYIGVYTGSTEREYQIKIEKNVDDYDDGVTTNTPIIKPGDVFGSTYQGFYDIEKPWDSRETDVFILKTGKNRCSLDTISADTENSFFDIYRDKEMTDCLTDDDYATDFYLEKNREYYLKVKYEDEQGKASFRFVEELGRIPTIKSIKKTGKKTAKIKFDKVTRAISYDIMQATGSKKFKKVGTTTKNTYTVKGLKKGKKYKFYIVANITTGVSDWQVKSLKKTFKMM